MKKKPELDKKTDKKISSEDLGTVSGGKKPTDPAALKEAMDRRRKLEEQNRGNR